MTVQTVETFLSDSRIDQQTWEAADISWGVLQEIAADHRRQSKHLSTTATLLANVIQEFNDVHSVRWRVKEANHVLEKIVRKRADKVQKYAQIDKDNYHEVMTDLVGIRALHLFKEDFFAIDASLRSLWTPVEPPTAYIRDGDENEFTKQLQESGFEIKQHSAGYRSVHYIIASQPLSRRVFVELQVRTIFEEGWSEIDHRVRYPNFSDDRLVGYFLAIFNRLAGSADEMGSFVRGLTEHLDSLKEDLATARSERDKTVQDMEAALTQLEALRQQDATAQENIAKLRAEVNKLKRESVLPTMTLAETQLPKNALMGLLAGSPKGLLGSEWDRGVAPRTLEDMMKWGKP